METFWQVVTFLFLFGLVVGLAYLTSRLVGGGVGRMGEARLVRVVEALPVGRDRLLVLVEVGGEYLLVGSAPGGVNLIRAFEGEAARRLAGRAADQGPAEPVARFRRTLGRLLGREGPE